MTHTRTRIRLFLACLTGISASLLYGADKAWNGSASANWNTDSIWTPAGMPTAEESVSLSNTVASPLTLTIPSGTAAVAASISFDNTANSNIYLTINNGGSLTVSGAITNPAMNSAWFQVYNSTEANAATVFTASSLAGREIVLLGSGSQYLTTGYDIKYGTQLNVFSGSTAQTNYYRQVNGVITITSGDYGLALTYVSAAAGTNAAAYYTMDGGTLQADRIGCGNGNGNNGGSTTDVPRWPAWGFFDMNNGTIRTRSSANNVWFENGSTFGSYDGTSSTVKDTQRYTGKPVRVRLAQTGAHTFDASYSDSHIVLSPTSWLTDKPGEAGTLTKTGPGNLILTGGNPFATNNWSGDTTVSAGKVQANFNYMAGAQGGMTLRSAYSPSSKLILNGGGFELVGRNNATNSVLSSVTVPAGGNSFAGAFNMTVPSTAGLTVGQAISNQYLLSGTYIRRIISSTQIGLSHISTSLVAQAAQAVYFGEAAFTSEQTVSNVELVAAACPVTVTPGGSSTVLNFVNVNGSGGMSKAGNGLLRLTGTVAYDGKTAINAGTLEFASGEITTLTNAITGASPAVYRQSGPGSNIVDSATNNINTFSGAVIVDGGTLQMGSGYNNQGRGLSSASSYTINSGATITTARDSMGGGAININGGTLTTVMPGAAQITGPLTMSGGTLEVGNGRNTDNWNAIMLNASVTVTGTVASVIRPCSESYNGRVNLTCSASADGSMREFIVSDVTGNADADLTVSANLRNSANLLKLAGLIKSGAGTLLLSGSANNYGGATIVSNGTLLVSGGISSSAVTVISGACFGAAGTNLARVAGLTLNEGAKLVWSYDGDARRAGRVEVLGTLTLPATATLDVGGSGFLYSGQTLISAAAVSSATDLSGWAIEGAPKNSRVLIDGNAVTLLVNRGTFFSIH